MQNVLFVCLGNICRSPSAEAVFRTRSERAGLEVNIDSAGTGGWHIGEPPYGRMQDAAKTRGYDLSTLRARQFSRDDFADFDLIVVMDDTNLRDVERLRPQGNETEVRLMTSYLDTGEAEVPDPYFTRDFDGALDLIERASDALIRAIG